MCCYSAFIGVLSSVFWCYVMMREYGGIIACGKLTDNVSVQFAALSWNLKFPDRPRNCARAGVVTSVEPIERWGESAVIVETTEEVDDDDNDDANNVELGEKDDDDDTTTINDDDSVSVRG